MAIVGVTEQYLTDIADAIRAKSGTTGGITPANMSTAIDDIPTGVSNFVQGTFTTGSSAGVGTVNIDYSGDGYPIAAIIVVNGGANNTDISGWYNSVQRYAVGQWTMTKSRMGHAPNYTTSSSTNINYGVVTSVYKNSTSSSTSYTRTSSMTSIAYSDSNASNAALTCVRFRSNTTMSYYVNTSSYGLHPNVEYAYYIVYSS